MVTITEFDLTKDTDGFNYELNASFDGFVDEGFYVKCFVDCEESKVGYVEEETNYDCTALVVSDISFWMFKIYDMSNKEINLNEQILREVKNDLENEITKKLECYE